MLVSKATWSMLSACIYTVSLVLLMQSRLYDGDIAQTAAVHVCFFED